MVNFFNYHKLKLLFTGNRQNLQHMVMGTIMLKLPLFWRNMIKYIGEKYEPLLTARIFLRNYPLPFLSRIFITRFINSSLLITFFNLTASTEGFPYYSRPGIVLDDPEFKPHIGGQRRPIQVQVPNKGDVFDIMVSAIQGPGDKAAMLTRKCIRNNISAP